MSSSSYSGSICMNPNLDKQCFDPMYGGYPHIIPKVFLDGVVTNYYPQNAFSWSEDSVVVVRDKLVLKYMRSSFTELLAKNEKGEVIWMDGRNAPYSTCWGGEYLDEEREAYEYTVEEYNLETFKRKKYKVVLEEDDVIDNGDLHSLYRFLDEKMDLSHFEIESGVLSNYCGDDVDLVIPEGVTEIKIDALRGAGNFNCVVIPSTVTKIPCNFCNTEYLEVDKDNPKYYIQDGCLIDREEKKLVWAYSGNTIPDDGSVVKIGSRAFEWRCDLSRIVIPDVVDEIGDGAFSHCYNLNEIIFPIDFLDDAERVFGCKLVRDGEKWTLDPNRLRGFTF